MTSMWHGYLIAGLGVLVPWAMNAASAELPEPRHTSVISGGAGSAFQTGGVNRPKLYDNTSRCSVGVQALAVGGSTFPDPALSILDYFETRGGTISAFDLYLLNGGGDPSVGGGPQPISEFKFFAGSDATQIGTPIPGAFFRTLPQNGSFLPSIPVHVSPAGAPLMIKVAVDYDARTYNVTDAATGTPLIDVGTGVAIVDQDIGNRPRITLPPGKVGILLRLGGEWSVCAVKGGDVGDPQAGPVLAGGGSGNEDGFYIVNAEQCPAAPLVELCGFPDWDPSEPCKGGAECSIGRPHHGIMMTLYMGASEAGDGDNTTDTARRIKVGTPSPCAGELVTLNGFIGDNGQPSVAFDASCFDGAPTPDVEALVQECMANPDLPQCVNCTGMGPPDLLADVDIYKIMSVSAGDVYSFLVEGTKSPVSGSLWDPFLKVWGQTSVGLDLLETSDNYGRVNSDAFTTVAVPEGVSTLFVGVSSSTNKDYEPDDPTSIESLCPEGEPDPLKQCADRAGGYLLTVGVVEPDCVEIDDQSCDNNQGQQYGTGIHEPDDTMADADDRGSLAIGQFIVYGAIGDGAFGAYGQDVDIYKVVLDGLLANVRRITAQVPGVAGRGFPTVFDLVLGLYDSRGVLLATGDQHSTAIQFPANDQSRPQLAAPVCGTGVPASDCPLRFARGQEQDGIYYIAIFGTDRGVYADGCDNSGNVVALLPATPPSLLNFPHDGEIAGTQDTDLRPTVGGRVNLPGDALSGPNPLNCTLDPVLHQCYRINILTSNSPLVNLQGFDDCEGRFIDGAVETDDSVFDACEVVGFGTRLSEAPIETFWLGNGPYGAWQGDVDFHRLSVPPGKIVSVNIADMEQPAATDHSVRSYLAFHDGCGNILATHDYSLEEPNHTFFGLDIGDGVINEIAANISMKTPSVPVVPCRTPASHDIYLMVGIDNGNMLMEENTPFDATRPGTTLSRRFEINVFRQRRYGIGVTVLDPVGPISPLVRMFVVPIRGFDADHVSCFLRNSNGLNGSPSCWPPILELDPSTGRTLQVLDGGEFFRTMRNAQGIENGFSPTEFVSANPLLAYDGRHLWIVVESCSVAAPLCARISRTLFKMNPNLRSSEFGRIELIGPVEGLDPLRARTATGMVELNGFLYLLDNQDNEQCQTNETCHGLRWWNKEEAPLAGVGGRTIDLTQLSGEGPDPAHEFDHVFGDLGSDGETIYMPCSFEGLTQGLCAFIHNPMSNITEFKGIITEPVTNLADTDNNNIPDLTPGPQLGGFDFINSTVMVASDRNGPIVEFWDMASDTVTGLKLPPGFVIHRITAREADCNNNGVPDRQDIKDLTSEDCNGDGFPDECEIDSDSTAPGGPFFCVIACDPDCNNNGVPDECDIASGVVLGHTIGGAVYTDCDDRLTSGEEGVEVTVSGPNGVFSALTSGPSGTWHIPDVPCGDYTVTPHQVFREYCHIDIGGDCPPEPCETSSHITVDAEHRSENLSIQFLGQPVCIINDLNYDEACTIVFDTELFVQCVYGSECVGPDGQDLRCPADCNCDGLATIVFDARCFVHDVYVKGVCGECPDDGPASASGARRGARGFTIGGAVYDDEANPLLSGIEGVGVQVRGAGRKIVATATTAGPSGIWRVDDLPPGTYTVVFERRDGRMPAERDVIFIVVNEDNEAANLSLRLPRSLEPSGVRSR